MSELAHEARTDADLYQGLYRAVLSPNLHERQMRAAYVGVYKTAIRMGLTETAARSHAARAERRIDHKTRAGLTRRQELTGLGGRVL